jgi:hypothetical protein
MDRTGIQPQFWQRWQSAPRMSLLATFEDSVTGTRVKEFCQSLTREVGCHCRIVEHVWPFSTLRLRELQEIAAEEASASDLIIISAHQAEGLPEEVRSWIELWVGSKARPTAVLLGLLDSEYEAGTDGIGAYLQEVARRAGMELLILKEA